MTVPTLCDTYTWMNEHVGLINIPIKVEMQELCKALQVDK